MNKIIAISARKRRGKDTVADYIASTYGYTKYALATPFKQLLCKHFGFTEDQINGVNYDREIKLDLTTEEVIPRFKRILEDLGYTDSVIETVNWGVLKGPEWSVRTLMQAIGTDIGCDQVDKYIWMHAVVKRHCAGERLVISDCRQDHEMEVMRSLDALVIHVVNPSIKEVDTHITERGLPILEGDPVIINNFDNIRSSDPNYCRIKLANLYQQVDQILTTYK